MSKIPLASWESDACQYLEAVAADPAAFTEPTWAALERLTGKSKATLWRRAIIYERYLAVRRVYEERRSRVRGRKPGHRRTLEERVSFLEGELAAARSIVEAHLRKYHDICRALEDVRLDPVAILGDFPGVGEEKVKGGGRS